MPKIGAKALNININPALLERLDKYRFSHMFPTRTEAIEFLLDHALRQNPERTAAPAKPEPKGNGKKGK